MSDFEKTYSITISTKKARDTLRRLRKSVDKLDKKIIAAAANSQRLVNRLGAMGQALVVVEHNAKDAGRSVNTFVTKTVVGAKKAEKSVKKIGTSLKKVGVNLKAFGRNMSMYVTLPLTVAAGMSLKLARNLNKSMAEVSTLLTGGKEQVEGLKQGIRDLSKETGKPVEDLADGLYTVVSALGESEDNLSQLNIATRASVAGVSTTKEAIDLLSAMTKGYGDTSEEAMKKSSDLAFQTVRLGVTTLPELSAAMGRVIPLAAAMETSEEELMGTMATLTGVTGNTAEVSTQLASVYSAFLKPTKELTKAANKQGFETAALMMKEIGFRKSLIAVNKAAKGNESALAKMFGRKEALVGALALLGGQSDEYTRKLGEMKKAVGSTDEAYRLQTEGINKQGQKWEETKRKMEDFAITVGDKLLPMLGRLMDAMEPIFAGIEKMSDDDLDLALSIGGIALALGPLIKAFIGLKAAMLFLWTNPIFAVIGGLALAVIYMDDLRKGAEWVMTAMEELWGWIQKVTTGKAISFFGKVFGVDTSGVAGSEENIEKQLESTRERRRSIFKKGDSDIAGKFSMGSLAGAGAAGGTTTNNAGPTVNFNGPVMDPEKSMRLAQRAVRSMNRASAKQLDSTANNSGPMEQ